MLCVCVRCVNVYRTLPDPLTCQRSSFQVAFVSFLSFFFFLFLSSFDTGCCGILEYQFGTGTVAQGQE